MFCESVPIKGLIDQSYKIVHKDRLHLENVPLVLIRFTFLSENGNNGEENLDKGLPFINTQETPLTESQFSFNIPMDESPFVLNNQKELGNVRAKI